MPSPRPGESLVLQEQDYLYGVGPVLAQVIVVVAPVDYRGEPWWQVEAQVANGTPGNHGGWIRRHLYVRDASLPAARQAIGARPLPDDGGEA